jgi:hypothetical protein
MERRTASDPEKKPEKISPRKNSKISNQYSLKISPYLKAFELCLM